MKNTPVALSGRTMRYLAWLGLSCAALPWSACTSDGEKAAEKRDSAAPEQQEEQDAQVVDSSHVTTADDAGESVQDAAVSANCLGRAPGPTAGEPCVCSSDCQLGERCLGEADSTFARGFCTRSCADDDGCAEGFFCGEATEGDPDSRGCLKICAKASDCGPGRMCVDSLLFASKFCLPHCYSDADCPATGHCDRYTGFCQQTAMELADNSERCTDGEDCRSGRCFVGSTGTNQCFSTCSIEFGGCPDGSACRPTTGGRDMSGCFRICTDDSQCLDDYECKLRGDAKICAQP